MALSWVIKCGTSGNVTSGNHPVFHKVGGGDDGGHTASQIRMENQVRFAGQARNLSIYLRLEQFVATVALAIDQVDTALAITTAGPTGFYEDTTSSVQLSPGDKVSYRASFVSGSGTNSYSAGKYEFRPDGDETISHMYAGNTFFAPTLQNNSQIERGGLIGLLGDIGTAEDARSQYVVSTAGRWEGCYVFASPNTRATDSEVHNRINNVKQSILVTIPAGMTGQFEDVATSDLVTEGDLLNWGWENFTGGGNWRIEQCSSMIARNVACFDVGPAATQGSNQNDNSVSDNPLGGGWGSIFTGDFIAAVNRSRQAFQRYDLRVAANSLTNIAQSWIQVDGSNQQQSPSLVQVEGGQTGTFTSRNQHVCPPGATVRVRRAAVFSQGAWTQGHFQCEASPEIAETTEKSWSMPIVHVEGGGRR